MVLCTWILRWLFVVPSLSSWRSWWRSALVQTELKAGLLLLGTVEARFGSGWAEQAPLGAYVDFRLG